MNRRLPINHHHAATLAAPARRVAGTVCVRIVTKNTAENITEVIDYNKSYITP
ncbi:hypothetical protein OpiT1DRAFT_05164, partial [Opitutaceae bacterium TAV1]